MIYFYMISTNDMFFLIFILITYTLTNVFKHPPCLLAVLSSRFSCGFCSRIGFGDNMERAEQRRSRHLGAHTVWDLVDDF